MLRLQPDDFNVRWASPRNLNAEERGESSVVVELPNALGVCRRDLYLNLGKGASGGEVVKVLLEWLRELGVNQ